MGRLRIISGLVVASSAQLGPRLGGSGGAERRGHGGPGWVWRAREGAAALACISLEKFQVTLKGCAMLWQGLHRVPRRERGRRREAEGERYVYIYICMCIHTHIYIWFFCMYCRLYCQEV